MDCNNGNNAHEEKDVNETIYIDFDKLLNEIDVNELFEQDLKSQLQDTDSTNLRN